MLVKMKKWLKESILVLFFSLFLTTCLAVSNSQKNTDKHVSNMLCWQNFCPKNQSKNRLIDHHIFLLSLNPSTKFADWVAYRVERKNMHGKNKKRLWKADPKVPRSIAILPSDYKGANKRYQYDRGHQAPLASFTNNRFWMRANYLSNITPQKAALNQGAWKHLENAVRKLSEKKRVYVVTGTMYDGKRMPKLPHAHLQHQVPTGYWKLIVYTGTDQKTACVSAFVLGQSTPRQANFCRHKTTLSSLQKRLGQRFFKTGTRMVSMGNGVCLEKICRG